MKPKNSDEFVDSLVVRDLTGANAEFTDADIDFARRNPDVLTKLADPLEVKKRYILIIFLAAVVLATTSKIIEYTGAAAENPVVNDLLTSVAFSVAIELFGAACIAFVMELIFEQRVKRNQLLVHALLGEAERARALAAASGSGAGGVRETGEARVNGASGARGANGVKAGQDPDPNQDLSPRNS